MKPDSREERVIVHDADLHAYLLGGRIGETMRCVRDTLTALLTPDAAWNAAILLSEKQRLQDGDNWEKTALRVFDICPHNLAERFLEALAFYRAFGSVGLPELLPLALVLLEADLQSYFAPRKNRKKPYRDHLPHQVRVAALAHLFLSGDFPMGAWNRFLDERIGKWHLSREHHLLAKHLLKTGLMAGFPESAESLRRCAMASAMLAGLVHDIGYALKTLSGESGEADRALRRFGIFPSGPEPYSDPPVSPVSRMYRMFWEETGPGDRYPSMCEYVRDHPDSPHSLAGAMWLAYLPERLRREGFSKDARRDEESIPHWGRLEFICQLGAMMALVHDFPLESAKKQGSQGFQLPETSGSESLCDVFPLCAVFSLSDILHEFGRPYIYTSPTGVRVYAPVLGIDLVYPDEWNRGSRSADPAGWCKTGLLSKEQRDLTKTPRIELFWDVRDPSGHFAPAGKAGAGEAHSFIESPGPNFRTLFDEGLHGADILPRLSAWGLDRVFCQRDVELARKAEKGDSFPAIAALKKRSTPTPTTCALAVYPLEDYDDNRRALKKRLKPGALI